MTTLRLSTSTTSPSTMQQYMDNGLLTESLSLEVKLDVVKTLSTILLNLQKKGTDIKYRTLNMNNEKLQARLFCFSGAERLLVDLVGFCKQGHELVLQDVPSPFLLTRISQEWLPVLSSTQSSLASMNNTSSINISSSSGTYNDSSNNQSESGTAKKAKLTKSSSTLSAASTSSTMSEKQKARRLLEEKKEKEKMEAKLALERTRAQIAADKRVRAEDENWKPSVCSAAAKGGTQLKTFRDRHGE